MSVKLRLLRKGRKRKPFYYIVAADARAPRDGRFIERVGSYNPNTNPATIDLDLDKSVQWLQNGAQPTDTVRAILSYKGAMYKNHLLKGAAKGAFPVEDVETKFNAWMEGKSSQIDAKKTQLADAKAAAEAEIFERESKVREEREKAILAKNSPLAEEVEEATAEVTEEATEAVVEEATEEVAEEVTAETEAPLAEEAPAAEEPAAEEPAAEEPKAEAEAPAEEEKPAE
ncbi:MAG: 30S ribosomal protein S16 [Bacteroidetes bacterium]|nr:30S ribosomal protein S16 [Bacteroidota bacterium]